MSAQLGIRFPKIRTPVPVAPGSRSSEESAAGITDPMRARSYRLIILELQSADRPLSREELSARTGIKESTLCARLSELRIQPAWVDAVDRACTSSCGKRVDGYRLAERECAICGAHRGMKPGKLLCGSCAYDPSTDDAA